MRTAKRIIVASLTAIMMFQGLAPSTEVFAQELDALEDGAVAAACVSKDIAHSVQKAAKNFSLQSLEQTETVEGENNSTDNDETGVGGGTSDDAGDNAASGSAETDDTANSDTASDDDSSNGAEASDDQADSSTDDATADEAESQDADAATAAEVIQYKTAKELGDALSAGGDGSSTTYAEESSRATTVTLGGEKGLAILSHADPAVYQDASISVNSTGKSTWDTTAADLGVSFEGLGSADVPFKGTAKFANNTGEVEFKTSHTFYNGIELNKNNGKLKIVWAGTDNEPIAASKVVGREGTFDVEVGVAAAGAKLTSPLLGEVEGDMTLAAAYDGTGNNEIAVAISSNANDAGLLANTVHGGTLTVEAFKGLSDGSPTIKATGPQFSAGGLIGSATNETIILKTSIDLSAFDVQGAYASGGFIGKAADLNLAFGDDAKVKPALKVGSANSTYSGGVIGDVSFAGPFTVESGTFDFEASPVELGATKRAGGLFGRLDVTNGDVTIKGGTYKSKLTAGNDGNSTADTRGSYGGIAGNVFATSKGEDGSLHALTVQKASDGTKTAIEFEHASGLCYAGGIVGYVGDKTVSVVQPVAVVLNGVSVACKGDVSASQSNGRFGGAVGVIDMNDVLDVRDFTLSSDSAIGGASQNRSAGIAGSTWIATIKFSGVTDLSGAQFADNDTTGQLVNENYNSLIFASGSGSNGSVSSDGSATGWTLKRSNAASKTDDIATYGEVVRLGNGLSGGLLTLDSTTHVLTKADSLAFTNNSISLSNADDFAKLAITWQTNGFYSMVTGVEHIADDAGNGLGSLPSSTISVTSTINLSGTGLTGISKDRVPPTNLWEGSIESSQLFSGTLTGGGAINLAVGEPYGMRGDSAIENGDTSDGDGKIYRHGRLGLFNGVTSDMKTAGNVTIGGTMRFENGTDIDAGTLAAQVAGTGAVTVSKVTCSTKINFDSAATGKILNVGGIFGSVADACTLTLGDDVKAQAAIANTSNAADIRVGELAGYVTGDKASNINVSGLEVGADSQHSDIEIGNSNNAKALVGGLIGFIQQGSAKKNVSITGLSYKDFSMSVGTNGDPRNGAGGLLGYSWGNAIVTIGGDSNSSDNNYAIKTDNATVTANSATEFGGLLYVMSGHLIIQNYALDFSGASLSAASATSFGVLLARGAKEEKAGTFGGEGSKTYAGLYLEDKTPWDEAYRVKKNENQKLQISAKSDVKYFDEWIANVTKASQEKDGTPNDNDWNTVVSLHTQTDALDMSGNTDADNSYKNRTEFGGRHPTNSMTRYYYNLDRCWEASKSVFEGSPYNLSTPEALMIWNVCCYAPDEIKAYIAPSKQKFSRDRAVVIGGTDKTSNEIDLTGYSYYPTNNTCKITIQNTKVTFAYSKIKDEQASNKSNTEATQHANMHAALIRAFAGDAGKTLSVSDVTLAGSTGIMVNDNSSGSGTSVSGALVCRSAYGTNNKTASVATISIDGLTLEGLVVDGANGVDDKKNPKVAPLLINDLSLAVTLNVKNLSVKEGSYIKEDGSTATAASSLFGNLGGSKTTNTLVNATLSNNVSVPSAKGATIFTRASFFESFGYGTNQSGSASYTFNEGEQVTYGAEIDSNGEYDNKQLWYYNAGGYGVPTGPGLVSDGDIEANPTNPQYPTKYLPYVKVGKSGTCYHEMKVNQRPANLLEGCGTYSDPYAVKTEYELVTLTNYINDENISDIDEWQVTITSNQDSVCERRQDASDKSTEVTYQYDLKSKTWKKVDDASVTLSNEVMHRYLQSAYYSIEPADDSNEIDVDANTFNGFGSLANPFRGVIVGNLKKGADKVSTINIKLADDGSQNKKASYGLIRYSYGSVVRQLKVTYGGGTNQIAYANKDTNSGTPGAFFGGVIGCIMGGDNIIDGVPVSGGTVSSSGDKAHLVPIGGYVGAICGGGVIFRNFGGSNNWRSATKDIGSLYNNPYVGRVVDGYAFSEDCEVDNGDANYKIMKLDDSYRGQITTSGTEMAYSWPVDDNQHDGAATVEVKSAMGLLILSAIINSGAAAGAAHTDAANDNGTYRGSRAYEGCSFKPDVLGSKTYLFGNEQFGKVRNATYEDVGKTGSEDAKTAKNDDEKAPGNQKYQGPLDGTDEQANDGQVNSPYLVKKYADWATGYICATGITGIQLKLTGDSYDMSSFGPAYQGLSGRYYSNACVTSNGVKERKYITPSIACIDGTTASGSSASITVANNYKEYTDDDYRASGVGALFNNIAFTSADYVGSTIKENDEAQVRNLTFKSCSLSISYIGKDGELQTKQDGDTVQVGIGCLSGVTSNLNRQESQGVYKNVVIDNCTVTGGASAGGLIGSVGYMGLASDKSSRMVAAVGGDADAAQAPVKLIDCLYKDSTISAEANAGGFVGKLQRTTFSVDVNTENQSNAQRASGESVNLVGENSTVRGTSVWAANKEACAVGGLLGLTAAEVKIGESTNTDNPVTLHDVVVTTDLTDGSNFANTRGLGGIVGRAENSASIKHVAFESSKNASAESPIYVGSIRAAGQTATRYRYVGGMVGYGSENLTFDDCNVSKVRIAAYECSGGIAGMIASGKTFTANGVKVGAIQVDGAYSGGILGQSGENSSTVVSISNSTVSNSSFKTKQCYWADHPDGRHTYSGGILGDTKGTIKLSNILVSKNEFTDQGTNYFYQGQLFGDVAPGDIEGIYVSGLNVQLEQDKTNSNVPGLMHYRIPASVTDVNKKCYFAFADYNDVSIKNDKAGHYSGDGSDLYNDDDASVAVASANPYITTNPVSGMEVKASSSSDAKKLFGDGMAIDTAATIQDDVEKAKKSELTTGGYAYTNIGGCDGSGNYQSTNSYDSSSKSTFNDSNAENSKKVAKDKNFNVLVVPGNDTAAATKTVTNYLNLVTNGGFSDARKLNPKSSGSSFVTARAEVFKLIDSREFVKDEEASKNSAFSVVNNGTDSMSFHTSSDWDNGKGRFTLLTVTFHDGAGHTYKVQVPIVVKRMLEINFSATYTYGSSFNASKFKDDSKKFNDQDYAGYKDHVLVSSGEAMTGYLTWTYNKANDKKTEYGWNTHLANGGSMGPLNKTIQFEGTAGGMPAGTQLTLVDVAHDNRYYTYTVKNGAASSVRLSDFTHGKDDSYEELWLSEIMGVAASDSNTTGAWIQMTDDEVDAHRKSGDLATYAGAKIGSKYYCTADKKPNEKNRYTLTVPNEDPKSESFYLIVRTPSVSNAVNGTTTTSVSAGVNTHINKVWPDKDCTYDTGTNTASTYSINSSYTQALGDNNSVGSKQMAANALPSEVLLDVTDTITFDKNQQYNDKDSLYFQFESSLVNYGEGNTGATGYPSGTTGTVNFYVKVDDKPYKWEEGEWKPAAEKEAAVPAITLPDDGKDLAIPLATKLGSTYVPVDLKDLRKLASDAAVDGATPTICITVKSDDMKMSYNACQMGISANPSSAEAGKLAKWTQTSYRGCLSTNADTLAVSNMTATHSGNMQYYRLGNDGRSTISLEAYSKAQLGINVDDLDPEESKSKTSSINLTAKYDFTGLHDGGAKLAKGTTVTYTFSLEQRQDDGTYAPVTDDLSKYISSISSDKLGTIIPSGNAVVFTDAKQSSTDKFKTQSKFEPELLTDQFTVKVNNDIEERGLTYANYRIVLTTCLSGNGAEDYPDNAQLLTGYNEKHSDYVTYTITKIKTSGIDHK